MMSIPINKLVRWNKAKIKEENRAAKKYLYFWFLNKSNNKNNKKPRNTNSSKMATKKTQRIYRAIISLLTKQTCPLIKAPIGKLAMTTNKQGKHHNNFLQGTLLNLKEENVPKT